MTLPDISQWLRPDWRPHPRVRALVTTRLGRHSPPPWQGFNLGMNCGDDPARVEQARRHVHKMLAVDHPPAWLEQVHGDRIIQAGDADTRADGVWAGEPGWPCVVLTADCLPVLLARQDGSAVAAVHAGWRGLHGGIAHLPQQAPPAPWRVGGTHSHSSHGAAKSPPTDAAPLGSSAAARP